MPTLTKGAVAHSKYEQTILGQKLALARLKQGLTQLESLKLAGLITEYPDGRVEGVTKGFLAYVESARRSINLKELESLAKVYQVPVKWFLDKAPLSENEEKVLVRLMTNAKRRTLKLKGFPKMSTETPNRQIVAVVTPEAPRKRGRPRKHPEALSTQVAAKPKLNSGDKAVLEAIKSCTEMEKYWVAKAIETLLTKVRHKVPTA